MGVYYKLVNMAKLERNRAPVPCPPLAYEAISQASWLALVAASRSKVASRQRLRRA
jgi:hypothetical protein